MDPNTVQIIDRYSPPILPNLGQGLSQLPQQAENSYATSTKVATLTLPLQPHPEGTEFETHFQLALSKVSQILHCPTLATRFNQMKVPTSEKMKLLQSKVMEINTFMDDLYKGVPSAPKSLQNQDPILRLEAYQRSLPQFLCLKAVIS